tara:strand:+ start:3720 stop:4439 length:720 start_codon:yes stop_codon:yes gene_type:complete
MGIEYQRNMSINYGKQLDTVDFNKLSAELSKKGLYLTDHWEAVDEENGYGYNEVTEDNTVYQVVLDGETLMTCDWNVDAHRVVKAFKSLHPTIESRAVRTEVTTKRWVRPEGNVLQFGIELDGTVANFDNWGRNKVMYDGSVNMTVYLYNNSLGLSLEFQINWECDTVQRKEAIEDAMVELPLKDMGLIQSIVEGRIKTKQFGFNVEDVQIDCHFDAKTESRSECTPDIIKQVREARKQ